MDVIYLRVMDSVRIVKEHLCIHKKMLSGNLKFFIDDPDGQFHNYEIEIKVNAESDKRIKYNQILPKISEYLFKKSIICNNNLETLWDLYWVYKNYYNYEDIIVFLPDKIQTEDSSSLDLETLENISIKKNTIIIFGYTEHIFNDIITLNRKRFITQMNKIIKKCNYITFFSYTNLQLFNIQLPVFMNDTQHSINWIDVSDDDIDYIVELINDFDNKSVYVSLNNKYNKIIEGRITNPNKVFFQSYKECEESISRDIFSVYILSFPKLKNDLDILHYLKYLDNPQADVYIDSNNIKTFERCKLFNNNIQEKIVFKDSYNYKTYNDCLESIQLKSKNTKEEEEVVILSDYYLEISAPESFKSIQLNNISKSNRDFIRNYVKLFINNKLGMDVTTCQLSTPSSPKDRSRKLNSVSNKISSFDYRCDVTCEIFKDYKIGIIVWSDLVSNRKNLNTHELNNSIFVYQTTEGHWKYTMKII